MGKADAGKCSGGPPSTGFFCKHDAKSNACGKCTTDGDCGDEKNACWASKDAACPKALSLQAQRTPCPDDVKCCKAAPGFCHTKYNNQSFCDPSTPAPQQLGDGCSCPWGAKADAGKCSGGPPSTGFFCKHDAKSNACGKCTTDGDCGDEKNACWASKDAACPKALSLE